MGQLSLEKTFLIAPYVEGIVYEFFPAIFSLTLYIHFSPIFHGKLMFDRHANARVNLSLSLCYNKGTISC
ncbi:hypothetical protein GYMLUDRAFT_50990 [Collybiopsis luxurians FD-317 M1]|uniref:Uncharacterized protein n=1 Tax=Collybiopsis luxurians FD-317 M1 TaxID=944289 RepID=A0A0D0BZJ1_9AGAR|nr:hypothetical protein GYMLUDRAFT_50990 [Collybiopsis luxurians FD-317 M1]